jgi:hypothetical protein
VEHTHATYRGTMGCSETNRRRPSSFLGSIALAKGVDE